MTLSRTRSACLLAVVVLAAVACTGGDDASAPAATSAGTTDPGPAAPAPASTTTPTSTSAPSTADPTPTTTSTSPTPTTVVGSGVVATRAYELAGFDRIGVVAFTLAVTAGDAFAVSVTADDNVLDHLVVEVREGALILSVAPGTTLRGVTLGAQVTMPELAALDGAGGATVDVGGFTSAVDRDFDLSGGTTLTASITAGAVGIEASGASQATLTGTATALDLDVSGAGVVTTTGLPVVTATVELSGASRADVAVTGTLDADLSGGSRLRHQGGATPGDVETSGGSTVEPL